MTTQNETQTNATIDTFKTKLEQKKTAFTNEVAPKFTLAALLAAVIGFFKPEIESIFPHLTFLFMAFPFFMMGFVLHKKITWEKPEIHQGSLFMIYLIVSSTLNVPALAIFCFPISVLAASMYNLHKVHLLAMNEYIKFNDVDDEEKIKIIENQFIADRKEQSENHSQSCAFIVVATLAYMIFSSAPFFIENYSKPYTSDNGNFSTQYDADKNLCSLTIGNPKRDTTHIVVTTKDGDKDQFVGHVFNSKGMTYLETQLVYRLYGHNTEHKYPFGHKTSTNFDNISDIARSEDIYISQFQDGTIINNGITSIKTDGLSDVYSKFISCVAHAQQ